MPTKEFVAKWVNNPGKSKAGKPYYNIKAEGDEENPYWAGPGVLSGISQGDHVVCEFTESERGRRIVAIHKKTNSAGQELKSYRQSENPDTVDGKCIHGLVVAFIGAQLVPLDAEAIARAYKTAANGYHNKGSIKSAVVQSGPRHFAGQDFADALNDELPENL